MRPLDIQERLDRIEERMATREDIDELRREIVRMRPSRRRRLGAAVFWGAAGLGFAVLVLVFADWLGIAP